MALNYVNVGSAPGSGDGDLIRDAFIKVNGDLSNLDGRVDSNTSAVAAAQTTANTANATANAGLSAANAAQADADALEVGSVPAVVSVASAATTDIGAAASSRVAITGTTTITSFGSSTNRLKFIAFTGVLTLTHNATSLILPTAANIVTQAGDHAIASSDSSGNWRIRHYQRADGAALVAAGGALLYNAVQTLTDAQKAQGRRNLGVIAANDSRLAAILTSKALSAPLDLASARADDFKTLAGVNVGTSTNASLDAANDQILNQSTDANVKSLLHFEGTNGATTTTDDVAGHTITLNGGASISTTDKVFGSSSLRCASASQYLTIAAHSDFLWGTGDFSYEFRVRLDSLSGTQVLLDTKNSAGAGFEVVFTGGVLRLYDWSAAAYLSTGTFTPVANTWFTIQASRASGTLRLFVNGTLDSSASYTANLSTACPLYLGNQNNTTASAPGYYDELRVSNIARNTTNYTPATSPFSVGSSGVLDLRLAALALAAAPSTATVLWLVKSTSGTITVNTNLVGKVSRDNGTTWTTVTLALVHTVGGYGLYLAEGVDVTAQPSGTQLVPRLETTGALGVGVGGVWAEAA